MEGSGGKTAPALGLMPGELHVRALIGQFERDRHGVGEAAWGMPAGKALLALEPPMKATALVVAEFRHAFLVLSRMARARPLFTAEHVGWLLDRFAARPLELVIEQHMALCVKALKSLASRGHLGASDVAKAMAFGEAIEVAQPHGSGARYRAQIADAIGLGGSDPRGGLLGTEPWLAPLREFVAGLSLADQERWAALFRHATAAKHKPTEVWITTARALIRGTDAAVYGNRVAAWADAAPIGINPVSVSPWTPPGTPVGLSEANADLLRGLVLIWALVPTPTTGPTLARLAHHWLKKVPGVGSGSRKLGNAALTALGMLPDLAGVPLLTRLSGRLRTGEARKALEAALVDAAQRAGLSREHVEEVAVGDAGLDVDTGTVAFAVGPSTATLTVCGARVSVNWTKADRKPAKSAPIEAKSDDPEGVKDVAAQAKELGEILQGVRNRLERTWATGRTWTYASWRTRWLDHPLVAQIARKQIWRVGDTTVLWNAGELTTVAGVAIAQPHADAEVRLWHPVDEADADAVAAWRQRVEALEVVQPVKQAWREVYRVAPAELTTETYSNRFGGHVLRQHAFTAIAQSRGWRYQLRGPWDGQDTATRELTHASAGWRVAFVLDGEVAAHGTAPSGVYNWVGTGQVRFLQGSNTVPVARVPTRLFSEIMRDVDLFVSVCSVGLDPSWQIGRDEAGDAVWHQTALQTPLVSELVRRDALAHLLPRLKMADRTRIDDRWLHVRGQRGSYRIHLGSGAVQTDGGRYVCIVVDWRKHDLSTYLPFEGDLLLAAILSKAILLLADDRITDPTILRQLV